MLGVRGVVAAALAITACADAGGGATDADPTGSGSSGTTSASATIGGSGSTDDGNDDATTDPPPDVPPDATTCERLVALADQLPAAGDDATRQALVDDFVALVAYDDHGFPLRCDDQLGVVLTQTVSGEVSVAGDFNGFTPSEHILTSPVQDFPFRYALVDVPDALDPGLYKFAIEGSVFFADPLARRFGWDAFGEYSMTDAIAGRSHLERWPAFAEGAGDLEPRDVYVYRPANADDAGDMRVLYLHDGQNVFDPGAYFGGWGVGPTTDALIASNAIEPLTIVALANTVARIDEYTHVPETGLGGGQSDAYAEFVALGVKPFIDARYATHSGRGDTAVAGSSLGGLVSLYIALRYPDEFGFVASMSGTLAWGQADAMAMADLYVGAPPSELAVYLDSGGAGPCPGGTDNYCPTLDMRDTLETLGWTDGADLIYRHDPGAPHNEAAWASRFGPMLVDWFPGG